MKAPSYSDDEFLRTPGLWGYGGARCWQQLQDTLFWERMLDEHGPFVNLIELGTGAGGFSWWLWGQCQARRIEFYTFDNVANPNPPPGAMTGDIFSPRYSALICDLLDEPSVLLCDNGDKPREVARFAGEMSVGGVLGVHDFGTEIRAHQIPQAFTPLYHEQARDARSLTRFYKLEDA